MRYQKSGHYDRGDEIGCPEGPVFSVTKTLGHGVEEVESPLDVEQPHQWNCSATDAPAEKIMLSRFVWEDTYGTAPISFYLQCAWAIGD